MLSLAFIQEPVISLKQKKIIIGAAAVFAITIPFLIFNLRAPVIVVSEESFTSMYGKKRMRKEMRNFSLDFFRPVKNAVISNDAGDDIIPYTVSDISRRPYCVLFPFRFVRSARLYQEINPDIRVVVLEGKYTGRTMPDTNFFVYRTDIETDFLTAGKMAVILGGQDGGQIAVFIDPQQNTHYGSVARESFVLGVNSQGIGFQPLFYTTVAAIQEDAVFASVILAGTGWEYLEKKTTVPSIALSWLDPALMPQDITVVFDDSPFGQLNQAVRLASLERRDGRIPSKITVLERKIIPKGILRKLQKIR